MRNVKLVVAIMILFAFVDSKGQEDGKYHSLSVGTSAYHIKDVSIQLNPVKGKSVNWQYGLLNQAAKRKTSLSINWNKGVFNTIEGQARLTDLSIAVTDGFRLFKNADRFRVYLGYGVSINPSYTKVNNKDYAYYSWSSNNSLDLYQSYSYSWKQQAVSIGISIPVIGFSSRPVADESYPTEINEALYNSYDKNFFTSLHNSRSIAISARFKKNLNERWELFTEATLKTNDLESGIPLYKRSLGIHAGVSLKMR